MTRRTLMVVDDEPDMGEFVCAVAQGVGFEARCVHHGREIMGELDRSLDVLVLDLFMPDVDGIELIRFLGAQGCPIPLILMSGVDKSVLHSAQELAAELGLQVVGVLNKPFRKADLTRLLEDSAVARPRPGPTAPAASFSDIAEDELRQALVRREFAAYFQPQIEIGSRRIIAAEALVRWQSPERGMVSPGPFISLAERMGVIAHIDDLVLQQAIVQCRAWHDAGMPLRVSINFSPGTLKDLGFPDRLAALMAAQGLQPEFLSLEITETGVMEDLAKSLDILTRFRMKGFRLSIDDFGTGYSSLDKLARIPFTELKIDQSFITHVDTDPTCQTIARLSIMLAHELDMTVVAEGIETEAVWDTLASMGCDIGQGYWMSRPMPADECLKTCGQASPTAIG